MIRGAIDFAQGFFKEVRFPETGNWQFGLSGGRSSAMLLKVALEHFGGALPPNYHVVFNNTGKEHPATLEFVARIQDAWKVGITWLEYAGMRPDQRSADYKIVSYETASRRGEPFSALLEKKFAYLPRRVSRICTTYLKVYPSACYMREGLGLEDYGILYGYRADETQRLQNALLRCGRDKRAPRPVAPLIAMGITKPLVLEFWKQYEFDLGIPAHLGNCIFCFMKGEEKLLRAARDEPDDLLWWIEEERLAVERFAAARKAAGIEKRPDTPDPTILYGGYAALRARAQAVGAIPTDMADDAQDLECNCTD